LQANNGFPGTSLPRSTFGSRTGFSGSHVMGAPRSMPSVPRMGGGGFGHVGGGMAGGMHMAGGGGGGGMHMGGGGGGGHGFGR
jgi:hypothetical protein